MLCLLKRLKYRRILLVGFYYHVVIARVLPPTSDRSRLLTVKLFWILTSLEVTYTSLHTNRIIFRRLVILWVIESVLHCRTWATPERIQLDNLNMSLPRSVGLKGNSRKDEKNFLQRYFKQLIGKPNESISFVEVSPATYFRICLVRAKLELFVFSFVWRWRRWQVVAEAPRLEESLWEGRTCTVIAGPYLVVYPARPNVWIIGSPRLLAPNTGLSTSRKPEMPRYLPLEVARQVLYSPWIRLWARNQRTTSACKAGPHRDKRSASPYPPGQWLACWDDWRICCCSRWHCSLRITIYHRVLMQIPLHTPPPETSLRI